MLVLTRKIQQQIQIGENITITILRVKGRSVRIGIEAPGEVKVLRAELPKASMSQETEDEPVSPSPVSATTRRPRPGFQGQTMSRDEHKTNTTEQPLAAALLRRRSPGVGTASSIRYPNRLGAASLRGLISQR